MSSDDENDKRKRDAYDDDEEEEDDVTSKEPADKKEASDDESSEQVCDLLSQAQRTKCTPTPCIYFLHVRRIECYVKMCSVPRTQRKIATHCAFSHHFLPFPSPAHSNTTYTQYHITQHHTSTTRTAQRCGVVRIIWREVICGAGMHIKSHTLMCHHYTNSPNIIRVKMNLKMKVRRV
jgi:hypothetical protein